MKGAMVMAYRPPAQNQRGKTPGNQGPPHQTRGPEGHTMHNSPRHKQGTTKQT
jgi:hypothetical protein